MRMVLKLDNLMGLLTERSIVQLTDELVIPLEGRIRFMNNFKVKEYFAELARGQEVEIARIERPDFIAYSSPPDGLLVSLGSFMFRLKITE